LFGALIPFLNSSLIILPIKLQTKKESPRKVFQQIVTICKPAGKSLVGGISSEYFVDKLQNSSNV
jgi:hypothetical protein